TAADKPITFVCLAQALRRMWLLEGTDPGRLRGVLPDRVRWLHFWARYDPVCAGPLTGRSLPQPDEGEADTVSVVAAGGVGGVAGVSAMGSVSGVGDRAGGAAAGMGASAPTAQTAESGGSGAGGAGGAGGGPTSGVVATPSRLQADEALAESLDRCINVPVVNQDNLFTDHTTYWQNMEQV